MDRNRAEALLYEARRRLAARSAPDGKLRSLSTMELIPALLPGRQRPIHLKPIVDVLETAWTQNVVHTFHGPPQHWKSETICAFAVATWLRRPRCRIMYLTHNDELAGKFGSLSRDWARLAGIKLRDDTTSKTLWQTVEGGGFFASGMHGGTGWPADIVLMDDPYGTRQDAESATYRERVERRWYDVALPRVGFGHTGSAFLWHTRWHPDDLIGKVTNADDVPHTRLPAVSDEGKPLLWALETYKKIESTDELAWWSLFQGEPQRRGGALFSPHVTTYRDLPTSGLVYSIGIDLAASEKTHADFTVAIVMARELRLVEGKPEPFWYVVEVLRVQRQAPEVATLLAELFARYPTAVRRFYSGGGGEKAYADLLGSLGAHVGEVPAGNLGSKYVRAQPVAARWNRGRIMLPHVDSPHHGPWVEPLRREVTSFTGIDDKNDDQVDALAAGHDVSAQGVEAPGSTTGGTRVAAQVKQAVAGGSWRGRAGTGWKGGGGP